MAEVNDPAAKLFVLETPAGEPLPPMPAMVETLQAIRRLIPDAQLIFLPPGSKLHRADGLPVAKARDMLAAAAAEGSDLSSDDLADVERWLNTAEEINRSRVAAMETGCMPGWGWWQADPSDPGDEAPAASGVPGDTPEPPPEPERTEGDDLLDFFRGK